MLPFGVTIPATVPQRSEIPEGLMNYPVFSIRRKRNNLYHFTSKNKRKNKRVLNKDSKGIFFRHNESFNG